MNLYGIVTSVVVKALSPSAKTTSYLVGEVAAGRPAFETTTKS
jgi:hypothetical protein